MGKEYIKAIYCHPAYLIYMPSTSCKLLAGWIIICNQSAKLLEKYQQPQIWRWYYPNARKWRGTKEPLGGGVKEQSEKASLKFNIQKLRSWHLTPITSWPIYGETMETVADFIFLGSKITADGDCSHEIKRHLLLRRKAMTNPDSILKSRDISLWQQVQFSHSVMSISLWPHGLQYARLSSPTPGACSNSCPLSQWFHTTISSSVISFFSADKGLSNQSYSYFFQ